MSAESFKRKLTAILSADVKGYSRLISQDEEATVKTLRQHRATISGLVSEHRGRVVDSPGDNILAEFGSVVDAVKCAVKIQETLKGKNAELPENRRMDFRIGVNLGDVIDEEDRIYGDGVNIAARLEGLSDGGGICISGTAFDQVKNKLSVGYQYLGKQTVKNIPDPVRAYKVLMEPEAVGKVIGEKEPKQTKWGWKAVAAVAVLVLVAGALVWNFYGRTAKIEPASKEKMAFPLPDKPSIAVLPFVNMSDDPQQEYFSDGMTEDLITDLSKISGLFVIARNSTFVYKEKPVKIRQVAEELGVRYVLEGSVRRAGDQFRINAQFIDAMTGQHLWAERYDGSMSDVFSLQDKINQKIVAALAVKLNEGEKVRLAQKWTNNIAAYDEYLKGREQASRLTKEDYDKAEACYKRALDLDPKFTQARATLAMLYLVKANQVWDKGPAAYMKNQLWAAHHLREAMKEPTAMAYRFSGEKELFFRQYDIAISQQEKALSLDPSDPVLHAGLSWALSMAGRPAEAMEHAERAMRLDPINPDRYLFNLGFIHFCLGNMEEAATLSEKMLKRHPEWIGAAALLAAASAHLGRDEQAKAALDTLRKGMGNLTFSLPVIMFFWPFKEQRVADLFAEGLIKAGMPGQVSGYIHVSKKDQITGDELREFVFPSTTTGFGPDGSQWSLDSAKDGTVTIRAPWVPGGIDTGRSWLEGDKVCSQYQYYNFGMVNCGTTFKNPRGTPERMSEYARFTDTGITVFSRVR